MAGAGFAQNTKCLTPAEGSVVAAPENLYSSNGVLTANFTFLNYTDPIFGFQHYCYTNTDGVLSPTLRLNPGDKLHLSLTNSLDGSQLPNMAGALDMGAPASSATSTPCSTGLMTGLTTNVHFHGLNVPPTCHQDEVATTMIQQNETYRYAITIPTSEPPGLYWYHPHSHGLSDAQVYGGASGIIVVEGIQNFNPALSGLPERIVVLRDQPNTIESEVVSDFTPTVTPDKDVSVNYVPIVTPNYTPAVISMRPGAQEFWRVANAAADTIFDLSLMYNGVAQAVGVVGLDGVPLGWGTGSSGARTEWAYHVYIPPGGRAEFIVNGPASGVMGKLVTAAIDNGLLGDVDPARTLATVSVSAGAALPGPVVPPSTHTIANQRFPWLANVAPTATRSLYFSERQINPNKADGYAFYLTVDGQTPHMYSTKDAPNITTTVGAVEDWTIENRAEEAHEFHMHQLHFLVLEVNGQPVTQAELRDTYQVDAWDGTSTTYPSIKVRMDFRDPEIAGTFVYHCHILQHEDRGMMGTILVNPASTAK